MILHNDSVSIGDCVYSFPGTLQLAKKLKTQWGEVSLHWTNSDVGDLFPHGRYGFGRVWENPSLLYPTAKYQRISFHDVIHKGAKHKSRCEHPTAVFMAHCGFPELSDKPIKPEIVVPRLRLMPYDVIIAPYVLADLNRFWEIEKWQQVVNAIRDKYSWLSIAVIGGTGMPSRTDLAKIDPNNQDRFFRNQEIQFRNPLHRADQLFDKPLSGITYLMSKAKLVMTVDSGPGRIMQAIDTPHILLAHNTVSKEWATYPEAISFYGDMKTLEPEPVIEAAFKVLGEATEEVFF